MFKRQNYLFSNDTIVRFVQSSFSKVWRLNSIHGVSHDYQMYTKKNHSNLDNSGAVHLNSTTTPSSRNDLSPVIHLCNLRSLYGYKPIIGKYSHCREISVGIGPNICTQINTRKRLTVKLAVACHILIMQECWLCSEPQYKSLKHH